MPTTDRTSAEMSERIGEAVREHPSVLRAHGGSFGEITSPLPGRRVTGVRVGEDGSVEVGVVALLDRPLPDIAAELRGLVHDVAGPVPVHITVADAELPGDRHPPDPSANPGSSSGSEARSNLWEGG